jgi:signal transduction histidine kinase
MANDSRGRSPWFDRLAHDLRSPLTPLQTAAYLLRTDPTGSNARELCDIVVRQSQRMARMIDELDDWSRAEQGRLVDRGARVDIGGALDMAIGSIHGCTLEPNYGAGAADAIVLGDTARLSQMFRTLVEQICARDVASARVEVARLDGTAELVFSDKGPVLDDDARRQLLSGPQIPAPDDGLGLRLLIAKAIVDAHAGTLAIEGPNESTTQCFRVTLPLA